MTNDNDPVEQNAREQIKERAKKAETQKVARGCCIGCMIFVVTPMMIPRYGSSLKC